MTDSVEFRTAAEAIAEDMVGWRRHIHAHPELGTDNPDTQQFILSVIAQLDPDGAVLDVTTGTSITSVVATLRGAKPGPTVLLRADTDALPMDERSDEPFRSTISGRAHTCGHDGHVAMLLGAMKLLIERRDQLAGTVRFIFQPGEEGFGGAKNMLAEGILDDGLDRPVEAAFALHVTPNAPVGLVVGRGGPIMAATDDFDITISGAGAHASTPHFGNDPLPAACETVLALQSYVTRRIDAFDPAVLTVGHMEAGTTTNVIAPSARMEGTIRTVSETTRAKMRDGLAQVVNGVASAHACTADISLVEGYPVTVNDAAFAAWASQIAESVVGPGTYLELPSPIMGAEDFSYILQRVKGAMLFLGVCPDEIENSLEAPSCHSDLMRLNERALPLGAAIHASVAWQYCSENV